MWYCAILRDLAYNFTFLKIKRDPRPVESTILVKPPSSTKLRALASEVFRTRLKSSAGLTPRNAPASIPEGVYSSNRDDGARQSGRSLVSLYRWRLADCNSSMETTRRRGATWRGAARHSAARRGTARHGGGPIGMQNHTGNAE